MMFLKFTQTYEPLEIVRINVDSIVYYTKNDDRDIAYPSCIIFVDGHDVAVNVDIVTLDNLLAARDVV